MKCEICSSGDEEVICTKYPIGDCGNCGCAWNYMSLMGPGTFSLKLSRYDTERVGKELVATVEFNDNDPKTYTCRIKAGKYIHLEEQ